MSQIIKKGNLPKTPHTEYYAIPGVLALEEIHGSLGFGGPYTRKLHIRKYPTIQSKKPEKAKFDFKLKPLSDNILQPFHIYTGKIPFEGDCITSRKPILYGKDTIVSVSKPSQSSKENIFFKNGEKHELFYIQDGEGLLKTEYGNLAIKKGLYIVVPKGTIYQIELISKNAFILIVESTYPIGFAPHYLNAAGQATLMAPIVETEIEIPEFQEPIDKEGEYIINVKHSEGNVSTLTLDHHPFDIVGWEGAFYPFGFDIENQHPLAREIHTAPPVRQTFQSGVAPHNGFSICSFTAQIEGWHEKDIPAPYAHSNVDSDEVMFFSNSNYGAREGYIQEGSITLHPGSLAHSPHGDAALKSTKDRGKLNDHLAVMLDTFFESLNVTEEGFKYADKEYPLSWYKSNAK
jgi:homogentisate 1,2-dioxygenase